MIICQYVGDNPADRLTIIISIDEKHKSLVFIEESTKQLSNKSLGGSDRMKQEDVRTGEGCHSLCSSKGRIG